ncbi:LysE family translocator [Jannaschia pohangensis]|uniref:Threonine/homoserine/homoserine lactone efflux protein n=1 Tax=Jannaschia pohangensis TaxID=390807 RepID=A0A1I3LI62_9RHOB|nr:LysE family transporter [Jannaschia pohangensis]SFI84116.1 Threonine/homoserine/homoserine lactone efflux protein [Jannaschia pohangensis]
MIAVLAAFSLVAVAPGPANLAVSVVAMSHGIGPALRMAAGLALGLAVWGVIACLGFGALLAGSEVALTALRLLGGAYLCWLASRSARAALGPRAVAAAPSPVRPFRTGLLLNLSNPKAVFAWLAALSMGLGPEAGPGFVTLATAFCAVIGLCNYLGWALLLSRGPVRRAYARAAVWIDGVVAALFAAAGLGLIRQGLLR